MILTCSGFLILAVSLFRAFSSNDLLVWVREFNRAILGLLVVGVSLIPEWGVIAIVFDALLILIGFFALRAAIQSQGAQDE